MADTFDVDQSDLGDGEREALGLPNEIKNKLGFGWSDPSAEYPDPRYHWKSSVNKAALGDENYTIDMGGADPSIIYDEFGDQFGTKETAGELDPFGGPGDPVIGLDAFGGPGNDINPEYTKAQVQLSKSGHVMMHDDTPGNEKVLIKHKSGHGVELQKDGSISLRTKNNLVFSVDANGVMVFEGDLRISCKNLKMDATGDLDLNVGGDMNLTVGGDLKETVYGAHRTNVTGNRGETVQGNSSLTVLGSKTNMTFGSFSNVVKGDYSQTIAGSYGTAVSGQIKSTSETEIALSTPNMNLAAADMTVVGEQGTIGGENIIMYNYNSYTGKSVHAGETFSGPVGNITRLNGTSAHYTTFHGSLNGKAAYATRSDLAAGTGSSGGVYTSTTASNKSDNTIKSVELPGPNQSIMSEYLTQSNRGIEKVLVDEGNYIFDKINRTAKMGGVARRKLTTAEARAKLKDPKNAANKDFVAALIGDGTISKKYLNAVPESIGRSYSPGKTAVSPKTPIRAGIKTTSNKLIKAQRSSKTGVYTPDPVYNPQAIDPRKGAFAITAKTLVGQGIPISTFLAGRGGATNLGHIATFEERQALARQLLLQAEVVQLCRKDSGAFSNYRLIVTEGVYKPEPGEELEKDSVKDLARTGRAITYELYNSKGNVDPSISFDFAEYLAEYLSVYDEIRLDYDTLDPRGDQYKNTSINVAITVIMPELTKEFSVSPKYGVKTVYNGKDQSTTDLVEVNGTAVADEGPAAEVPADAPPAPAGFTRMVINGVTYDVGNDYVREGSVYKTFSGNSARAYAAAQGWIMPTSDITQYIATKARIITMPIQDQWNPDSQFYPNGDEAYHTQQIFELTGGGFPTGLVAGHKKDVVNTIPDKTCLWGGAKAGGGWWQSGGCPHGGDHKDYSQGLRPLIKVT